MELPRPIIHALARNLYRFRRLLPILLAGFILLALGMAVPFRIVPNTPLFTIASLLLTFTGLAIRVLAAAAGPGANGFRATGLYSLVRHPAVIGSFIAWSGVIVFTGIALFTAVMLPLYAVTMWLIMRARDRVYLGRYGDLYRGRIATIPLLKPIFTNWQPDGGASSRIVPAIRRESSLAALLMCYFTGITLVKNQLILFEWDFTGFSVMLCGTLFISAIVFRIVLRKR